MDQPTSSDPNATLTIEIPEPEIDTQTAVGAGDTQNDWLCAWCLNRVASETNRFRIDGQSEFVFANPARVKFQIITFSETLGCRPAGTPTLDHTWFPEHAWCYCLCERCGMHLGWFYSGPSDFAGLIKPRITRALYLMS